MRAHQQMPPVFEGCVHRLDGFVAPDKQRQNHVVKNHHIAHGQNGQGIGNTLRSRVQAAFMLQSFGGVQFRLALICVDGGFCLSGFTLVQQSIFFIDVSHIYSPRLLSIQMRCDCVML